MGVVGQVEDIGKVVDALKPVAEIFRAITGG
jgi:hypothetical protein